MTRQELAAFKRLEKRRDGLLSSLCVIKTWLSLPEDSEDTLYHVAKLVTECIEEERAAMAREGGDR